MQKRELLYNEGKKNFSSTIKSIAKGLTRKIQSLNAFESIVILACYSIVFSLINMIYFANASSHSSNIIHNIYVYLIGNFEFIESVSSFDLSNWVNIFVIGAKSIFIESLMLMSFVALVNLLSNKPIDFKRLIVLINISYSMPMIYSAMAIVISSISIELSILVFLFAKIAQYKLLYNYIKKLTGLPLAKTIYVYPLIILLSELISILYIRESIYFLISSL